MYELETVLLALALLVSGLTSAGEAAMLSLSSLQLRRLSKIKRPPYSFLVFLKKQPTRMMMTTLIANNIANISASILVAHLTTLIYGDVFLGITGGLLALVVMVFCEIFPKTYSVNNSEIVSLVTAPMIYVLMALFMPLIWALEYLGQLFPSVFQTRLQRQKFTEEEIRYALEFGVEDRAISGDERNLLERVLDFNDTLVKEIMVPREQIKYLLDTDTQQSAFRKAAKFKKNRYPVLSDTGAVVGVVSLKKLIAVQQFGKVGEIMDKPIFVSKESIASETFRKMQRANIHMAVAVDSTGAFEGVVTVEDLLEEIVGEIHENPQALQFVAEEKSVILVSGLARLHDIEKELGVQIPDAERFGSIAAYMHYQLKRIPVKGDILMLRDAKFDIREMSGNSISKIQVTRLKAP
ncbi:MAG: hemolysin family protein [Candidatus Micrarchaeia archaeon]